MRRFAGRAAGPRDSRPPRTLVSAGSATHIPYLAYLARGRDVDQPAVFVLLDSDASGDQEVKRSGRGPSGKPVIGAKFILHLAIRRGTRAKIKRLKRSFLLDQPVGATREGPGGCVETAVIA